LIAPVLRLKPRDLGERYRLVAEAGSFTFTEGRPTRTLHLAIGVGDQQTVDAFYASAIAAGGRDYGAPGERPQSTPATTAPLCSTRPGQISKPSFTTEV